MVKIRRADPALFAQKPSSADGLTPRQRERRRLDQQLRDALDQIKTREDVFVVTPTGEEKATTLRGRLVRIGQELGVRLAIRKHENGWLVGMYTEERKSNRGRKPKAAQGG